MSIRLIILVATLYMLEFLFTSTYQNTKIIRNKIQFVFQNKNAKYDYIFLGSSRVEYHIDTDYIDSISNSKSLNLGISGQDLSETFLTLKLLTNNNIKAKKYFIQIDDNVEIKNSKSFIGSSYFMPYIFNEYIKNHLVKYDKDYYLDYYIPFYRYINYGYKIGYRELLFTIANKDKANKFYIGLNNTLQNKNETFHFKDKYIVNYELLDEIIQFAEENNIDIYFYTAPYYNANNQSHFLKILNDYKVKFYIDSIKDATYFKDVNHLNNKGAKLFTKMIIRDFNLDNN